MSPQIIELLLFAAIAFFVINKLISILGTTDENNPRSKGSKFGEPNDLKDVTSSGSEWNLGPLLTETKPVKIEIDPDLLVDPSNPEVIENLTKVALEVEKFNPTSFIKNAAKAWQMIVNAIVETNMSMLEQLVDKRYIEKLLEKTDYYKTTNTSKLPDIKISEVSFFGNNIIIRLLLSANNMPVEEWTFTKSANQPGRNWYLSNIDQYIS